MARIVKPLSPMQVKNAKSKEKVYKSPQVLVLEGVVT